MCECCVSVCECMCACVHVRVYVSVVCVCVCVCVVCMCIYICIVYVSVCMHSTMCVCVCVCVCVWRRAGLFKEHHLPLCRPALHAAMVDHGCMLDHHLRCWSLRGPCFRSRISADGQLCRGTLATSHPVLRRGCGI